MGEGSPLISIVVPVYNQEVFIGRCLRSILKQSYDHLEVIVVNDGSTDHSRQIIAKNAEKDPRIILINQPNQGEAIARRSGYERARGEYIMFVDHDDCLPQGAIESLFKAIERTRVDVVFGQAVRKYGWKTRMLRSFPPSFSERVIDQKELFENFYVSYFGINLLSVSLWGKLYRKRTIDEAMAGLDLFTVPHLHFGGDEAFNLLLFPFLKSVYLLDKVVYLYRWGGLTSGYNRHVPELFDFSDFRITLLDKYQYEKGYSPLFVEYVNILITHVQQILEFTKWGEGEARQWLTEELGSRYLMQRMRAYFAGKTDIPNKCRMAMDLDAEGIVGLAKTRLKQQRLRSFLRRALVWVSGR